MSASPACPSLHVRGDGDNKLWHNAFIHYATAQGTLFHELSNSEELCICMHWNEISSDSAWLLLVLWVPQRHETLLKKYSLPPYRVFAAARYKTLRYKAYHVTVVVSSFPETKIASFIHDSWERAFATFRNYRFRADFRGIQTRFRPRRKAPTIKPYWRLFVSWTDAQILRISSSRSLWAYASHCEAGGSKRVQCISMKTLQVVYRKEVSDVRAIECLFNISCWPKEASNARRGMYLREPTTWNEPCLRELKQQTITRFYISSLLLLRGCWI